MSEFGSRLRSLQVNTLALPIPLRAAVTFVTLLPFTLSLTVAVSGRVDLGSAIAPLVGVTIGMFIAQDDRGLRRDERVRSTEVVLTGRPSGCDRVDTVSLRRLDRTARVPRAANCLLVAVTFGAVVAAPVLAAERQSAWWLLVWISVVPFVLITPKELVTSDPRHRAHTLREAMGAGDSSHG